MVRIALALIACLCACGCDHTLIDAVAARVDEDTDASLVSLEIGEGSLYPTFSASVFDYELAVAESTNAVTINATVGGSLAKLSIRDIRVQDPSAGETVSVQPGANTIPIAVTAADGKTVSQYTIIVYRATSVVLRTGQEILSRENDDADCFGEPWTSERFVDTGEGSIVDTATGLEWQKTSDLVQVDWETAVEMAGPGQRLPNRRELLTLVNYGHENVYGWLNSIGFVDIQSGRYWSSTTDAGSESTAWALQTVNGRMESVQKVSDAYYILVRGSENSRVAATGQANEIHPNDDGATEAGVPWPTDRFLDSGNGSVLDQLSGIRWSLFDEDADWSASFSSSEGLSALWRLPTIFELESIVSAAHPSQADWLAIVGIPGLQAVIVWSSTTKAGDDEKAWAVDLADGSISEVDKIDSGAVLMVWK